MDFRKLSPWPSRRRKSSAASSIRSAVPPLRYVSYKDVKSFTAALKTIYKAPREADLETLDDLYPVGIKSYRDHLDELATMYKYPEPIRRVIYTTNAIENFNRQLREVTKIKSAFVSDDALLKQLYLIMMQFTESLTMPIKTGARS